MRQYSILAQFFGRDLRLTRRGDAGPSNGPSKVSGLCLSLSLGMGIAATMACKPAPKEAASVKSDSEQQLLANQGDLFQQNEPGPGLNTTQQRVLDLNDYADKLLAKAEKEVVGPALRERGIADNVREPLTNYNVYLPRLDADPEPREHRNCFTEDGVHIKTQERIMKLKHQVEEAVLFLSRQHLALNGRIDLDPDPEITRARPFGIREIEIAHAQCVGSIMEYRPDRRLLRLGMVRYDTYLVFDHLAVYTADELQALWDMGVPFAQIQEKFDIGKRTIKDALLSRGLVGALRDTALQFSGLARKQKVWYIVNPYGTFQTMMRQAFGSSVLDIRRLLKRVKGKDKNEILGELNNLFESSKGANSGQLDLARIDKATAGKREQLASLSGEQLKKFVADWDSFLGKPENALRGETATMRSTVDAYNDQVTKIDVKIEAFIAIGNVKKIKVDANLFPPSGLESLVDVEVGLVKAPAPDQNPGQGGGSGLDVKAEVKGKLLAIYLVDHVDVKARVGSLVADAGFIQALNRLRP